MATYLIELTAVGAGAMLTQWVNEKPGKYGVGQTGTDSQIPAECAGNWCQSLVCEVSAESG